MNDEEIKAIEYWKEKLKDYKKEIIERQNDEFKGYGTLEDIAKLKYCNLQTVLNLIEKQKAEINYKDEEMFNIVNSDKGKLYKENQELKAMELKAKGGAVRITLEGLINLNNEIKQRDKEIEKKDNIIKELEHIFWNYELCEYEITDCTYRKCEYIADDETPPCKECIKEYFENKVKEIPEEN